ncbi:flagellar filament capping protein FliD [Desulfuromonas sp. AOP6]|uniref:flagellar filament capping protein FliD n=1 Tax=Desulfuromonas sp. AOP6 TaxID=1566351 RepID=UPI00128604F6|nr:flagellar filament capping protein FliD [Desulfuromonas sp. AOP6]BCA79147.1 flagellar hook-associated protein 2 [Desulfuromonas sp. AOP6]
MSITFGGLATGLDTNAIIDALMEIERRPIDRLEREQSYLKSRLDAFKSFDGILSKLQGKFEALDTQDEVRSYTAKAGSDEFFGVSTSGTALPGNYQIEVQNLAQLQKDVSGGYASSSEASFGQGTITINGVDIAYDGDSLSSLIDKINLANTGDTPTGVSASIINDGVTGYRMVLTGDDASTSFTVSGNETSAGAYAAPAFSNVQVAMQASILVDNIQIKSNTNTFDEAIPGITLDLTKANALGEKTSLNIAVDKEAVKTKINDFVKAYNEVFEFIAKQSEADWGKDSSFRSVKRNLQNMLTAPVGVSGSYTMLSQLGLKTERDGTLTVNDTTLTEAIENDLDGVAKLLAGESGIDGVSTLFKGYLDSITDSLDGILASRKESTDSSLRRIDLNLLRLEGRMEQKEKNLRAQYSALEDLVSSMNSQSAYLSQQLNALNA